MTFGLYLSDKCLLDKKSIPGRETVWVKAEWCERTKHICPHLVTFPFYSAVMKADSIFILLAPFEILLFVQYLQSLT